MSHVPSAVDLDHESGAQVDCVFASLIIDCAHLESLARRGHIMCAVIASRKSVGHWGLTRAWVQRLLCVGNPIESVRAERTIHSPAAETPSVRHPTYGHSRLELRAVLGVVDRRRHQIEKSHTRSLVPGGSGCATIEPTTSAARTLPSTTTGAPTPERLPSEQYVPGVRRSLLTNQWPRPRRRRSMSCSGDTPQVVIGELRERGEFP